MEGRELTEEYYDACRDILKKLQNNENVSRWDVFAFRKGINWILRNEEGYEVVEQEVEFLIDSCRESL